MFERYRGIENFEIIQPVTIDEMRRAEISIYKAFVELCNNNGLRFYLAGGTMIGALRHQGYVPWDDDIDITMPRPDFERFRALTSNGWLGEYKIMSIYHTPEQHSKPFDRIVDLNYIAEVSTPDNRINAWIDVMPWDGLPEDKQERKKHWQRVQRLKHYARIAREPISMVKKRKTKVKRLLFGWLFKIVGPVLFAKKIDKLGKKYSFDDAEYVGTFIAGYGPKEEMPKKFFIDDSVSKQYAIFEGIKSPIPSHYCLVLKHMYGDFMTIPQKEVSHIVKAYKIQRTCK